MSVEVDTKFSDAVEVLLKAKRVSAELLVRKLDIKRDQAEELLRLMAVEGFVGPEDKGKRELLLTPEAWAQRKDAPAAEQPASGTEVGGAGADENRVGPEVLAKISDELGAPLTPAGASLVTAETEISDDILGLTKGVHDIPLRFIRESAFNPRSLFNKESLIELGETLKDTGIGQVQVVTVFRLDEPDENGCIFELENGARRYRAAKLAGVETLRCEIVKAHTKADRLVRRVIANGMSEDMNPIDKGLAFAQILADCNGDKKLAAKRAGLGERGVRVLEQSIHRVNNLIDEVKQALIAGKIPVSHADLISHRKGSEQRECLRMCFEPLVSSSAAGVTDREEVLISEKALREKLRNRFAHADEDAPGQKKMFDAPPETEAQQLQKLEDQGTRTLESAGSDKPVCDFCEPRSKSAPPTAAPANPPKSNDDDYLKKAQAEKAARLDRLEFALLGIDKLKLMQRQLEIDARVAKMLLPPLHDAEVFAKAFGHPLSFVKGNRVSWFSEIPHTGTVAEFIEFLAQDHGDRVREQQKNFMARVILILVALPALEPSYTDEFITLLEKCRLKGFTKKAQAEAPKKPAKTAHKIPAAQIVRDAKAARKSKLKHTPKKKAKK